MSAQDSSLLVSLLPYIIISIPLAVGNFFLARRLNRSPVLWAILSLIPLFNLGFVWYAAYLVAFRILDRLDAIARRIGIEPNPT